MSHDLSNLPRVDRVSRHESLDQVRSRLGERVVVELARAAIDEARHSVLAGEPVPEVAAVAARALARANALVMSRARRVLNATGVMVHTNLGRAPLSNGRRARSRRPCGARARWNRPRDRETWESGRVRKRRRSRP